jgi:hypothetical protein
MRSWSNWLSRFMPSVSLEMCRLDWTGYSFLPDEKLVPHLQHGLCRVLASAAFPCIHIGV